MPRPEAGERCRRLSQPITELDLFADRPQLRRPADVDALARGVLLDLALRMRMQP